MKRMINGSVRLYGVIVLATVALLLSACSVFTSKPVPTSTFKVVGSDKECTAKVFNFAWGLKHEYGESSAVGIAYDPIVLPAKSEIKISFNPPPKSFGNISEILGNAAEIKTIDDYSKGITVSDKPGVYTYNYSAVWDEGSVAYVFKVKVEDK